MEYQTRNAAADERKRHSRLKKKNKLIDELKKQNKIKDQLVLDVDPKSKKVTVVVDDSLFKNMKPHQKDGVKFMYDSTIESISLLTDKRSTSSFGCILAHSMGLGKTFQVVTFVHTVLMHPKIKKHIKTILIIVPLNVVKNWSSEFDKWFKLCKINPSFPIFEIVNHTSLQDRVKVLKEWHSKGGVMIFTITLFSQLVLGKGKGSASLTSSFVDYLVNPGPDLVVVDEGHLLKNDKSTFNQAISLTKTPRRIILTGTPLQNNLTEYYVMVNFVKPHLLGTKKEFRNRFENPISNGQHIDSTDFDVHLMKRRSHILHTVLNDCVHRCDYKVLVPYLPPKYEYVISIKMTPVQIQMYSHYIQQIADLTGSSGNFFKDATILSYVWNHPVLLFKSHDNQLKNLAKSKKNDFEQYDIVQTSSWFKKFITPSDDNIEMSSKMQLMFSIIEECEIINDKLLIFSQSLLLLDLIEKYFAQKMKQVEKISKTNDYDQLKKKNGGVSHKYVPQVDFFRIDGKVNPTKRSQIIDIFNDTKNQRSRLMLVSTRAGGLGINLYGANRCIIFDASWNPSIDQQAIFRVFRYGQSKPVYIYRFTAHGTMENKIYDRQVTKQSLSRRVVDSNQIQRYYKASELAELFTFDQSVDRKHKVLACPADNLLAKMILKHKDFIASYHLHDSLLENTPEEELTETEKRMAWSEYEKMNPDLCALNENVVDLSEELDLIGPSTSGTNPIRNFPATMVSDDSMITPSTSDSNKPLKFIRLVDLSNPSNISPLKRQNVIDLVSPAKEKKMKTETEVITLDGSDEDSFSKTEVSFPIVSSCGGENEIIYLSDSDSDSDIIEIY